MKIQVFDPPMCCSTGVCGPSVDPALVRFSADLDWLSQKGVEVERYNLSQQPAAFAGNDLVKVALNKDGNDCLPLTLVDGAVVCQGKYPTNQARKLGVSKGDMRLAVEMAQAVKETPSRSILELADKYLIDTRVLTTATPCRGGGATGSSGGKCRG